MFANVQFVILTYDEVLYLQKELNEELPKLSSDYRVCYLQVSPLFIFGLITFLDMFKIHPSIIGNPNKFTN